MHTLTNIAVLYKHVAGSIKTERQCQKDGEEKKKKEKFAVLADALSFILFMIHCSIHMAVVVYIFC